REPRLVELLSDGIAHQDAITATDTSLRCFGYGGPTFQERLVWYGFPRNACNRAASGLQCLEFCYWNALSSAHISIYFRFVRITGKIPRKGAVGDIRHDMLANGRHFIYNPTLSFLFQ